MSSIRSVPAGDYELAIGMFEGERSIKFAIKQEIFDGSFYTIAKDVKVF